MLKIFEYLGILIFFYSNEHEPIHVHGKYDGFESTTEFYIVDGKIIEIKSVKYIGDFAVRISFSDGVNKLVDFRPFLESSLHPSIRKYFDESRFREYQIIDGNLNWSDYDMIFPIEDLYQGRV